MESVYKVVEIVGSSPNSWEEAAKNAVESAGAKLRDIRIGEITTLDMKVVESKVVAYRTRLKVSFKVETQ